MDNIFFTVFTPIYNRKHTIHRVWESLNAQTYKNFEWLIVNDGSTDGVESLLEYYRDHAEFKVRIYNQKNSGKHIAFNKAIDESLGYLLIPADSDDSFLPETIEIFERYWSKYGDKSISGIDVLCMDEQQNIIGDKFPVEGVSNYKEIFLKNKVRGEKWGCIRVDILKKFKFPIFEGVSFFPESYIWSQIGIHYNTVYLNIPLRTYYQDAGNQIMKAKKKSFNTLNAENYYAVWYLNFIYSENKKYFKTKDTLKIFASVWKSAFSTMKSPYYILNQIKTPQNKLVALIMYIPSYFMFKVLKVGKRK